MKRTMVLLIFLIPCISISQNKSADEQAIIDVITNAANAMADFDIDLVETFYVQDASRYAHGRDEIISGWEELRELYINMNKSFKNSGYKDAVNSKKNALVKVTGKTAWVICDNVWDWEIDGEREERVNKQITFMEKQKGEWKIAFVTFLST